MQNHTRINRRSFLRTSALVGAAAGGAAIGVTNLFSVTADPAKPRKPVPVILATDIGDDIDDTWALGFLLRCPELDLKLVATEYGKSKYRAKLLAKFLQASGRGHIPIAVGPDEEPRGEGALAPWIQDYDLGSYRGNVHADGVKAIVDTIMHSSEPVTLICIGPMPNVAAALAREPAIAKHARFVGMDGSVRLGYGGSKTVSAEWNVKASVKAAQRGLSADWDITITPLDTCGLVSLEGEHYRRVIQSNDPVAKTIVENYTVWTQHSNSQTDPRVRSTTLFDTVAVYLTFAQKFCRMERLGIRVTDDGTTQIDAKAKEMNVATAWSNLDGYRDLLVDRLVGSQ